MKLSHPPCPPLDSAQAGRSPGREPRGRERLIDGIDIAHAKIAAGECRLGIQLRPLEKLQLQPSTPENYVIIQIGMPIGQRESQFLVESDRFLQIAGRQYWNCNFH